MKRLLLVEDDRSLGATLCERLERENYEVSWVETKQRALKKLGEGLWDLVILDIGLPDGSGFEAPRNIVWKVLRLARKSSSPSRFICGNCFCVSSMCSRTTQCTGRLPAMGE